MRVGDSTQGGLALTDKGTLDLVLGPANCPPSSTFVFVSPVHQMHCLHLCCPELQSKKMGHDNLVAGLILQLGFLSCFMALTLYIQVGRCTTPDAAVLTSLTSRCVIARDAAACISALNMGWHYSHTCTTKPLLSYILTQLTPMVTHLHLSHPPCTFL
jgi:hypothetical protein